MQTMTEDDSGQLKRLLAERETYLQTASLGMLNIVVDVAGSFRNKLKAGQELTMYDQTLDVMGGVLQSRLIGISVKPRQESGLDRTKFLPGQHKGVSIEYFTEPGPVGRINLYGGLRGFADEMDLRDSTAQMRRSFIHTDRTDKLLTQPTQVNFHIKSGAFGETWVDFWFEYKLNTSFRLSKLFLSGEKVDVMPQFGPKDYGFSDLKSRLHQFAGILIVLIPNT